MLMSHGCSLFYPSNPTKLSFGKYCTKTNLPISANYPYKTYDFSMKDDKVNSYLTRGCHRLSSEPQTAADSEDADAGAGAGAGIGILEFFQGKNIFVTGATGLLGKVIVEKLLRSTSVDRVYLLIKAKDREAAIQRLKSEIINSELLTCLKQEVGDSYEDFVRAKVIAVVGDICEPNLGMDYESIDAIRKNVHVIIQSAACTTFNERYDLLVDANVIAPQRVMRFAKTCNKLQLFTHISTAYVNERREGLILEEPLMMGKNGVDVADEISLLLKSSQHSEDANKFFRKLGRQRAENFGWSTTYQLSKAMGEMSLNEIRENVPLLIIRPAIIESCYRQPVPGWIQGIRMYDPVLISYGKGQLPAFFANPQVPLDIIPADLVANTVLAATAKHGKKYTAGQINVYHSASGLRNPLTYLDAFEYLYEYFNLIEGANVEKMKYFDDFEEFSKFTREAILRNDAANINGDRKLVRRCNAKAEYAQQLCKLYEFATYFNARFDMGNTQKLIEEMSKEEQLNFEVDVRNVDWKKYLQKIHVPGVKKYLGIKFA